MAYGSFSYGSSSYGGKVSYFKIFYVALSVVETSIVSLVKGVGKILSVIESSIATISKINTFFKNLLTTEISVPSLEKVSSFFKNLLTTEISVPSLEKITNYFRSLMATEISLPILSKISQHFKSLIDSGMGADLIKISRPISIEDLGIGTETLIKKILKLIKDLGLGIDKIYKKITWKPSIIDDEDFSKPIIVQKYRTVVPLPLWINKPVLNGEVSDEIDVSKLGSFGVFIKVTSPTVVEIQIESEWGWRTIDKIEFDDPSGGKQFYPFWTIQFAKVRLLFTQATTVFLQLYCRT